MEHCLIDLELFSAPLCPFTHRVRLVLTEKGLAYRLTAIDPRSKPAAFLRISPHGVCPTLRHGETHLWESAIINEYLEETFPEQPLLPREPGPRAQARLWIEFANKLYAAAGSLLYGPHRPPALEQLSSALVFMEREGLAKRPGAGPFWLGQSIGLVDFSFYPWFEQLVIFERFRDFRMPATLPRLDVWRNAVAEHPSVRAIAQPPEFYVETFMHLDAASAA